MDPTKSYAVNSNVVAKAEFLVVADGATLEATFVKKEKQDQDYTSEVQLDGSEEGKKSLRLITAEANMAETPKAFMQKLEEEGIEYHMA